MVKKVPNRKCIVCGEMKESEGLAYKVIDDNTCYISGIGSCTDLDIKIPTYIDGYKVTGIGDSAFWRCSSLTSVYITDIAAWCNIDFENEYSNPLYYADNLYVNNELIKDLVIPEGVTEIPQAAFRRKPPALRRN